MMRFAASWFLLFIPCILWLFWRTRKKRGLPFPSVKILRSTGRGKTLKHYFGKGLVFAGLTLLIIALARPQTYIQGSNFNRQGIDIALILDVSGSMLSVDFEPNRFEVARRTIDDFITQRTGDRLSLILFAGEAYTRVPLTLDHAIIRESLASVTTDSVGQDGTAIGMAISVGINRLKKSDAASKIMVLLTDGDNNAGAIDPLTASRLAQDMGIRIYTIGVGSDTLIFPYTDIFGRTQHQRYDGGFDEALLKQIAHDTGGEYYRAMYADTLKQIFDTINRLERTAFDDENFIHYEELAFPLIQAAMFLLLAGLILDRYYLIQIP
jgi:Ca-activated chloride channel family protein